VTTFLIVNPAAGQDLQTATLWRERLRAAGVEPEASFDLRRDPWAERLGPDDLAIVAGGDGSVSSVAERCVTSNAVLGVLPRGTANDFAVGLGIPDDVDGACGVVATGTERRVDVGRVDDKLFLNVAHVGLGAEVAKTTVDEHKHRWRRFSYLRTLIDEIRAHRGFHARVRCDGSEVTGRWLEIAVANGTSFGGGHRIGQAIIDDGFLHVVAVRPRPLHRLVLARLRMALRGLSPADDTVVVMRCRHCRITPRRPQHLTADGEDLGEAPADFSIQERVLRVMTPPAAHR
jgi:YegS/Rv2252/BmrU family lipid kinase